MRSTGNQRKINQELAGGSADWKPKQIDIDWQYMSKEDFMTKYPAERYWIEKLILKKPNPRRGVNES